MPISTNSKLQILNSKVSCGFTLIELMVVVSLIGLATSIISASFLNYERSQRVKNAANQLKVDLRLVENKAASGDKGPGSVVCQTTADSLAGWYLKIVDEGTTYSIRGICLNNKSFADELTFDTASVTPGSKVISMPRDTKINRISHSDGVSTFDVSVDVAIVYMPLRAGALFYNWSSATSPSVNFVDNTSGGPNTSAYISPAVAANGIFTIEVSNLAKNRCHLVRIEASSGRIIDEKASVCSA